MTVLAVLQNQWFPRNQVTAVREIMARSTPERRRRLTAMFLFRSCYTGKCLRATFGEHIAREWLWENASPLIGSDPASAYPADLDHLQRVLRDVKPRVVLGFGKVACDALRGLVDGPSLICGPHPAARIPNRGKMLDAMARRLKSITK